MVQTNPPTEPSHSMSKPERTHSQATLESAATNQNKIPPQRQERSTEMNQKSTSVLEDNKNSPRSLERKKFSWPGECAHTSAFGQIHVCEQSQRFHEQVQRGWMPQGSSITAVLIKLRTKELVSTLTKGAPQAWVQRMSI